MLTIAVPTFNREKYLGALLNSIKRDIIRDNLEKDVNIIVIDNASTDGTEKLCAKLCIHKYFKYVKNESNIGAVKNVYRCFEECKSDYLWILGDDDCPIYYSIKKIIDHIRDKKDDCSLIYLRAKPIRDSKSYLKRISNTKSDLISFKKKLVKINSKKLALRAGVTVTALSSWVCNIKKFKEHSPKNGLTYSLKDTQFPHLEWILPMIKMENGLFEFARPGIFYLTNNSGGFNAVDAYVFQYTEIIHNEFKDSPRLKKILLDSALYDLYPRMFYSLRFGYIGDFDQLNPSQTLITRLSKTDNIIFKIIISNILHSRNTVSFFYKCLAKIYYLFWRKTNEMIILKIK